MRPEGRGRGRKQMRSIRVGNGRQAVQGAAVSRPSGSPQQFVSSIRCEGRIVCHAGETESLTF